MNRRSDCSGGSVREDETRPSLSRKVNENLDSAKDSSSLQVTVVDVPVGGEARLEAKGDLAGTKEVHGASRILAEANEKGCLQGIESLPAIASLI